MSRLYEVLEHTADIGIRARGRTLEETFANMACGLVSLVVSEPGSIRELQERRIAARAEDLEGLLVAWLAELVYLIDGERFLVSRISDISVTRCERGHEPEPEPEPERTSERADRDARNTAEEEDAPGRVTGVWVVTALARGESMDLARHALEMEIKGVSYHMARVEREMGSHEGPWGGWWVAQAIFDV